MTDAAGLRTICWPRAKRIFPLDDADARPPDGVLEGQAEQGTGRAGGHRAALFLGLPVLLPLPLRGADRGDGGVASAAHQLGLPGRVNGRLPGQGGPRCGDVLRCQPRGRVGVHVGVSRARAAIAGTCRREHGTAVTGRKTGELVMCSGSQTHKFFF